MRQGFFKQSELKSKPPTGTIPHCGACGLFKNCLSPKMPVTGLGNSKCLIVGEAPGRDEDKVGIQFVGKTGQYLEEIITEIGADFIQDFWRTNALICRPPKNREPSPDEIRHCRPNILKTIAELQPEKIVLLGNAAVSSVIGHYWKDDPGTITRWAGWKIPLQSINTWIFPTYHPSFVVRKVDEGELAAKVWFKRHLMRAIETEGRPWRELPNYQQAVDRVYDADRAVEMIDRLCHLDCLIAFDYETNMLKPESSDARIVCCSMAWEGEEGISQCISFPINTKTQAALDRFTKSKAPKIAANLKFEDRWTQAIFGHRVRNWKWDTMQAAHVLDNRPRITSVKFQAFVRLGVESYDDHIAPFLHMNEATTPNRILTHININDLLLYCGMDSLLELEIALQQMKEMKC